MAVSLMKVSLIAVVVVLLTSSADGEKIRCEICSCSQQNSKKYHV